MNRNFLLPPSINPEVRLRERIVRVNEDLRTEKQISGGRSNVIHLSPNAPWRAYAGGTGTTGWGQPRAVREPSKVVHLEGLLDKNGNAWAAGEVICTLPVGFRPALQQLFACMYSDASAVLGMMRIDVETTGIVRASQVMGTPGTTVGWVTLSGIRFIAQ